MSQVRTCTPRHGTVACFKPSSVQLKWPTVPRQCHCLNIRSSHVWILLLVTKMAKRHAPRAVDTNIDEHSLAHKKRTGDGDHAQYIQYLIAIYRQCKKSRRQYLFFRF